MHQTPCSIDIWEEHSIRTPMDWNSTPQLTSQKPTSGPE